MEEAHAEPFLHPRHRLADRRRRHAKLPSRNCEISGFRSLNEGIERSQTVHRQSSISDIQVRYVWNYGPLLKASTKFIFGPCQTAFPAIAISWRTRDMNGQVVLITGALS